MSNVNIRTCEIFFSRLRKTKSKFYFFTIYGTNHEQVNIYVRTHVFVNRVHDLNNQQQIHTFKSCES